MANRNSSNVRQIEDTNDQDNQDRVYSIAGKDESEEEESTIVLRNNLGGRYQSYNIAPTQNSVIIYKELMNNYIFETLSFGLIPFWMKPKTDGETNQLKELKGNQSKYFNCRKETLEKGSPIWNSAKSKRCVVPIEGYFEWKKNGNEKTPYYVHSSESSLIYLVGFYSHNTSFEHNFQPNSTYFSSFTIITGPAESTDLKDLSWLHPRKPLMIAPGTKQWEDWLNPDLETTDKLLDFCLETKKNIAFSTIVTHQVSKDVGKTSTNGEYLIKEVKPTKSPQKSIDSFFKKRSGDDSNTSSPKKFKTEPRN